MVKSNKISQSTRDSMESSPARTSNLAFGQDRVRTGQLLIPPWPEWSDADINAEKWDVDLKTAPFNDKIRDRSPSIAADIGFENPHERHCMPASLSVRAWRRTLSMNLGLKILPENENAADLDLISSNEHILHSELMRHIVTSIMNLHHLAAMKPFDEMSGNNFVPNGPRYWKPWSHVYAMCKVGKGTKHKPSVNKFGKYIIRLYLLGQWRRITVDDFVPVDAFGRVLLPTTSKHELWPILLSKALIQIAALTWTPKKEVVDFNAITCLTGWFMLNIDCERVPPEDVWKVCQKALMNEAEEGARYKEEARNTDAYQVGPKVCLGGGDRRDSLTMVTSAGMEENWGTVAVFAEMASLDGDLEEAVGEIGPCVGHQVLFSEARIIRLYDDGGPLPLWKTFRWRKWALKMGIIQPDHLVNVKSLRLFSPLKKWLISFATSPSTFSIFSELKLVELAEVEGEKKAKEYILKGKKTMTSTAGSKTDSKSGKKSTKNSENNHGKTGTGSKASTNSKTNETFKNEVQENIDPWMNFNVFSKYVTSLQLFYRVSSFKYCRSTNNVQSFWDEGVSESSKKAEKKEESKSKRDKKTPAKSEQQQRQQVSRTSYKVRRPQDHFYLICDSPAAKKIFITMGVVSPNALANQEALFNQAFSVTDIKPKFSLIAIDYNHQLKISSGICRLCMTSIGTLSRLLQLRDGLVVLKIWVDLPQNHFIQIVSQTEFRVGTVEVCHEMHGKPGMSLTLYGTRIFNSFASLKSCIPGSPDHVQALSAYHASYLPESMALCIHSSRGINKFRASLLEKCEEVCTCLLYNRFKHNFDLFYDALKELQDLMLAPTYGLEALQAIDTSFYQQFLLKEEPIELLSEENAAVQTEALPGEVSKVKKGNSKETNKSKANAKDKIKAREKIKGESKDKKKSSDNEKKVKTKKLPKAEGTLSSKKSVNSQHVHPIIFENQVSSAIDVMKKIVEFQPEWLNYYPFRDDLKERLACKVFSGLAPVSAFGDWFPLARLVVNVSRDQPATNGVYIISSAALTFMHIVNNDNQQVIPQSIRNSSRYMYVRNVCGYTIFAFGFCENKMIKEHSWKIHILARDEDDLLTCCPGVDYLTGIHISSPPPPLKVKHLYGHYIPNKRNVLFSCLQTVQCTQVLTVRVSTSCPKSEIVLRIMYDLDENGFCELVYEKKFTGKAILPSMPFFVEEEQGKQEPTVFRLEAELISGSWELTETEKLLVTGIKEKVQRELLVYSTQPSELKLPSCSRRRSSESGKSLPKSQEIIPQAAYWCIQVVVDAELENQVKLEMNTRKAQEIRRLKENWEEGEPGRHKRAMLERIRALEQREEENREHGVSFSNFKLFESFKLKASCIKPEQEKEWKTVAEDYGIEQQEVRRKEKEEHDLVLEKLSNTRAAIIIGQKDTNAMLMNCLSNKRAASIALLEAGYKLRTASLIKPSTKPVAEASGKKEKKKVKGKNDPRPAEKKRK